MQVCYCKMYHSSPNPNLCVYGSKTLSQQIMWIRRKISNVKPKGISCTSYTKLPYFANTNLYRLSTKPINIRLYIRHYNVITKSIEMRWSVLKNIRYFALYNREMTAIFSSSRNIPCSKERLANGFWGTSAAPGQYSIPLCTSCVKLFITSLIQFVLIGISQNDDWRLSGKQIWERCHLCLSLTHE